MNNIIRFLLVMALLPTCLLAQTNEISGTISNSLNQPIQFAVVAIEGTYLSTQTDADGKFSFTAVRDTQSCLVVRMIGFDKYRQCYSLPHTAIQITLQTSSLMRDEVVVQSTRADENSGIAFVVMRKEEIAKQNFGQDLPYVLNNQTSVVTTSDAGNGIGYTGLRIRGSDATRINVTINGIPVNDAESQGTFWVDLPDVVSSTENIQIQRGVGTSTNGSGSFGGSLNLQTELNRKTPYSEMVLSGGSFNSWRATAKAGTGLINNRWSFDIRLSQIGSAGFIDRGRSELSSWYLSGGYFGDRLTIKAITFSGKERTYQSWYGVSEDSIRAGNRTYNVAGLYYDSAGTEQFYKNQVDAYGQDYYQLHFIYTSNSSWIFNWAIYATRGKGYYEEYKEDQQLGNYGFNDTSAAVNDLIRRRWLDNWYYGATYAAHYNSFKNTLITIGGASSIYEGKHYGEVIWATGIPSGETLGDRYYDDNARKEDHNLFVKITQSINNRVKTYIDVQARLVNYAFTGLDSNGVALPQAADYLFMNPKVGLIATLSNQHRIYLAFGIGNKEPNRDDFTNSSMRSRPKPESLYDAEAGWKFGGRKVGAEINLYYMHYTNQLVLTGKVNDVGAYTRENVRSSFRRGIELSIEYNLTPQFKIIANATLSENKIASFTEYLDNYDTFLQNDSTYTNTSIAFSPNVISAFTLEWTDRKVLNAALIGKFVSKQYLDNTQSESRAIDPYFTLNFNASWKIIQPSKSAAQKLSELSLGLQVNNILNTKYSSNGYTYGYVYGGETSRFNYYYPQAGINIMGMLTIKFGQ